MNQTRLGGLIEALMNTAIGLIYTGISIARSYVLRRFVNARLHAAAMRAAGAVGRRA